jgi:hypothetical protein
MYKNKIIITLLSLVVLNSFTPSFAAATPKTKATIIKNMVIHAAQAGSGTACTIAALPFLSIGFMGKSLKKIADQPLTPLYEIDERGNKVESMKAKYLCDFFVFAQSTMKGKVEVNGIPIRIEKEIYLPMISHNNKLYPLGAPLDPPALEWVDIGVSIAKHTGFIIGAPLFIAGLATIKHGLTELYNDIQALRTSKVASAASNRSTSSRVE